MFLLSLYAKFLPNLDLWELLQEGGCLLLRLLLFSEQSSECPEGLNTSSEFRTSGPLNLVGIHTSCCICCPLRTYRKSLWRTPSPPVHARGHSSHWLWPVAYIQNSVISRNPGPALGEGEAVYGWPGNRTQQNSYCIHLPQTNSKSTPWEVGLKSSNLLFIFSRTL